MTKKKEKDSYLTGIIDKYIQNTNQYYPGFRFSSRKSFYNSDEPRSCEFEFSFRANNAAKTEYNCEKKQDIIHYTSTIQSTVEILNSGLFRLSNLLQLNDPQELDFLRKNLEMKFSDHEINEYKSNFFIGSFCKVINITI